MGKVEITIHGEPKAQARPRFVNRGRFVTTYDPLSSYKKELLKSMLKTNTIKKLDGKLLCGITFYMPIPKSLSKCKKLSLEDSFHCKKPDIDNLEKFVLDLLNGIAYDDDSQICLLMAAKYYSNNPRTEIIIENL